MRLKPSNLILIDQLFFPMYWVLNKLHFSGNKINARPQKKLIIKFFGMGSIIRIAEVLKHKNFDQNYELVTLKLNKEIVEVLGIKAQFISTEFGFIETLRSTLKVLFTIWRTKNVTIIDLERSSNLSGLFRLICSFGKPCVALSFDDNNVRKGKQQFITLKNKPMTVALEEAFQIKQKVRAETVERKVANKIAVNINAGDYLSERKYSIDQFEKTIIQLQSELQTVEFIFTGISSELAYVNDLVDRINSLGINYKNYCGKLSIKELVDLLHTCDLLITNDSGPMHLANYFQIPFVAIWGPTSSKLVGYKNSATVKNVTLNLPCSPCFIHPKSKIAVNCNNQVDCLNNLPESQVTSAVFEVYKSLQKEVIRA